MKMLNTTNQPVTYRGVRVRYEMKEKLGALFKVIWKK